MDSRRSHSFPGSSQPEHQFDHLFQFQPQPLLDESSSFASDSSSSVSLSSMDPMPANFQLPPPSPLSLSRRESDCSVRSTASSDGEGVLVMVEPRGRLTREQIQLLERQFSESSKPNTKIRQTLAETAGLPVRRVGNWFQNRRAKAKQQKRQEEIQTRQILALAGRRRATEPSSPVSTGPCLPSGCFPVGGMMFAFEPRRTKSIAEIPTTPARIVENSKDVSPYSSPSEASYASLARSVAVAVAAAAHADAVGGFQENSHEIPGQNQGLAFPSTLGGAESPWPMSRFSDYGSSTTSSVIYTPTPAGQLEDPFEYDQLPYSDRTEHSQPNSNSGYFDYRYPVEDFSAFAAAVETTTSERTFVLPAMPPTRFLRTARPSDSLGEQEAQREFVSCDSCPNRFIDPFGSVELQRVLSDELTTEPESQRSLAARRRAPGLAPLGAASLRNSDVDGVPQSAREPQTAHLSLPYAPMRRIKSTGARLDKRKRSYPVASSPPSSPFGSTHFIDIHLPGEDDTMAGATIRPRTTGSLSAASSTPLSQLFAQHGAPPTPVSPADSETVGQGGSASQKSPAECPLPPGCGGGFIGNDGAATKLVQNQISPPHTPHNSSDELTTSEFVPSPKSATTPKSLHFPLSSPKFQIAQDEPSSAVPRHFFNSGTIRDLFSYSMASAEEMSSDSGSSGLLMKEEAVPFEGYLTRAGAGHPEDVC